MHTIVYFQVFQVVLFQVALSIQVQWMGCGPVALAPIILNHPHPSAADGKLEQLGSALPCATGCWTREGSGSVGLQQHIQNHCCEPGGPGCVLSPCSSPCWPTFSGHCVGRFVDVTTVLCLISNKDETIREEVLPLPPPP